MLDLISRQAAIDAIINRTVTVDTDDQWLSGHAQCELEIIDIINALPSAEPKQQWIPCSERLPDKEGQYLVTGDAGGVVSIICDVFFHYDDGAPTWLLSQNVKAWMELPEAYREGEG